jgi:biopolymer transport protein ExbD
MNMRLARRVPLILIVLLLVAFWNWRRIYRCSAGIDVGLPADSPTLGCSDLVLSISKQHFVKINHDPIPIQSLAARLRAIYSQRYKHVLLVRADPDVGFQEVMGVIDIARGADSDMELVLLTPRAEKMTPCLDTAAVTKMD